MTPQWTITVDLTEERPGGPSRPARIWATRADGAKVGFCLNVGGGEAADEFATTVAEILPDAARSVYLAQEREKDAREKAEAAANNAARHRNRLNTFLRGGRFFGRVLVVKADDGAVWVQDPEQRDRGFGYRFESLADLWREWPDLRPVRWENGDLICESFAHETT